MLSYMVPSIEEKPPPGGRSLALAAPRPPLPHHCAPAKTIIKTHSRSSNISADSSVNSISSVLSQVASQHPSEPARLGRPNGNPKHPTLKRVSFGSSKGSMVETLIYESPLQEEPEPTETSESGEKASKVKVSFFECDRPVQVTSPEPPSHQLLLLDAPPCSMTEFARQTSTESGWDNPFRPDGDLSREADEIVELIKVGKPITPTSASPPPLVPSSPPPQVASAPKPTGPNGVSNGPAPTAEVHRTTALPPAQPEHVTLKKKPKSKCCVIQ